MKRERKMGATGECGMYMDASYPVADSSAAAKKKAGDDTLTKDLRLEAAAEPIAAM